MNPLIRQRLPVLIFVLGGIVLFAGLAFMALPVYTMARYERVEATYFDTRYTESNGNSTFVYDTPLRLYRFTPKGGTEKHVGIHSREQTKAVSIYFLRTRESDAEVSVSEDNWRSATEVTVLLSIGIALLIFGSLAILTGFVVWKMTRLPVATPVIISSRDA